MMCDDCWATYQAWSGYRLPRRLRISNDSMRDMSPAGVVERSRLRFEEWRDLVNQQQRLIRERCLRERHVVTVPSEAGEQFVLELGVA